MNARVYVGILLILIGVICLPSLTSQAQFSDGWVGATAWCWKYSDGHGIAHGSVGWGQMANDGGWTALVTIYRNGTSTLQLKTGSVNGYGGGAAHLSLPNVIRGTSYSTIWGHDHGGKLRADSNAHSM